MVKKDPKNQWKKSSKNAQNYGFWKRVFTQKSVSSRWNRHEVEEFYRKKWEKNGCESIKNHEKKHQFGVKNIHSIELRKSF